MEQGSSASARQGTARRRAVAELPGLATFEVCEGCGHTLLTGETSVTLQREGQNATVCSLCAASLLQGGFRHAA
jgi:hypothetical protein